MGVWGVVLDRRLNQDAEEEDRLVRLHCAKVLGALLACGASLNPRTVLILGKAERPVAQGPGHSQPGQGRLTGFWSHLATEEPLLVPLSLSALGVTAAIEALFRDPLRPEENLEEGIEVPSQLGDP